MVKTNHIPRLTDHYFTDAHHATNNTSKSKGVSILVSKDAKFESTDKLVDPEGRFIFLKGSCYGTTKTLANVYFPNTEQFSFCQKMITELTSFHKGRLILGGDFNVPLNPSEDTSSGKTYLTYKILKRIKHLLHSLSLIDTLRFLHPDVRDYTFYSIPYNRHARIDFLFVAQRDLHTLLGANIGLQTISDHAPIAITLNISEPTARPNTWRLNSSLLTDPILLPKLTSSLKEYFTHNITPEADPLMVWQAHKCYIRGELIQMGTRKKKEIEKEKVKLTNKICELETLHKQSLTTQSAALLLETRKSLKEILETKSRRFLFFKKKIYYEHGDKTGKILAKALRGQIIQHTILGIQNKSGKIDRAMDKIANHFHEYYTALYNLPPQHKPTNISRDRTSAIKDYLKESKLPPLTADDIAQLEKHIEASEIQNAIKDLKKGKSPGPDGFSAIYYQTFTDILTSPLTNALNSLSKQRTIPPDFLAAHITVLPKPGKDPTHCASYRPISLLNLDAKLMAKIIANRLRPLLHDIIGPDQAGFVPNREAKDNVTKSLDFIYAAHRGLSLVH